MATARGLCLCLMATMGLSPIGASAQENPATLGQMVERLGSADASVRMAASAEIDQNADVSLEDIEAALKREGLLLEQRRRLLGLAFKRFQDAPRAAMGVNGDLGSLSRNGAGIVNTVPGFPAARVLKSGDRVIHAAGLPVDSWDKLRRIIISRNPGDEIPITVVREGATLNLRVALGSWSGLRQGSFIEQPVLVDAWRIRSRDLRGVAAEPLDCGMGPGEWPVDAYLRSDADGGDQVSLVAGGEPRGGLMMEPAQITRRNFQVFPADMPRVVQPRDQAQAIDLQLQTLRSIQSGFRGMVVQNDATLAGGRLTDDQKAQLLRHNQDLNQQIRTLEENIILLERQLGRRRVRE